MQDHRDKKARDMSASLTPPPNPRPLRGGEERAVLKKDVDMALTKKPLPHFLVRGGETK
jgi:hypothetical protein